MNDLGRVHLVQAIANLLYGRNELLWPDKGGVIGHKHRVDGLIRIEMDFGTGHALHIMQFLSDLGYTGDLTHHAPDRQSHHGLLGLARAVHMHHIHIAPTTTTEQYCAKGRHPPVWNAPFEGKEVGMEGHCHRNSKQIYLRSCINTGQRLLTTAMTDRSPSYGPWNYMLLLLLAGVWGSSFILMKIGLFGWTPNGTPVMDGIQLGLLRICLAGTIMVPIALRHMRGLDRGTWMALAVNGFIGSLVPAVLFAWSQMRMPSAVAGMLNALSPLWTLVIAVGLYGTMVRRRQVYGLLLGFGGAIGLMSLKDASGAVHWSSAGLLVLATACYGLSINVVRNRLTAVPAVAISGLALSMTALPAGIGFIASGGMAALTHHPEGMEAFAAVVVLAWVGTAAALMLFNALIKRTDALFASAVTYVIPLVALFWGWVDGEWLGWPHLLLGGVVLSGVRLVAKG